MRGAAEATATKTTIPVVDFHGFTHGDAASRAATAATLRRAIEEFGFLYLKGHGVPTGVLDALFAQSRWFFAQPPEAKHAVQSPSVANNRGYVPPTGQSLDEGKPFDLKEIFHAGYEDSPLGNRWPSGQPGFQEAVLAFHDAAVQTCHRLMRAIASGYGLPDDYFVPLFDGPRGTTRMLHYPPLDGTPLPGQIRAGSHTDFGTLSLLFQDDAGGLEIQHPDGTWLPAPALPGAAIMNTGDLMQRWTNDMVRSSPHRVVNPVGEAAMRPRYSVVLFYSPRPEVVVECLAPCHGPDRPPRYPPVTAGEHVIARSRATHREGY
jgi:isopenicillin N synthase-like dioxygenase